MTTSKLMDMSCPISEETIINQKFRNYDEMISPPSIEFPLNEVQLQSDLGNLSPTVSIQQSNFRLSMRANKEWAEWVETLGEDVNKILLDDFYSDYEDTKNLKEEEEEEASQKYEDDTYAVLNEIWPSKGVGFSEYNNYKYSPEYDEVLNNIQRTNFETSISRPAHRADQDSEYLPSVGMDDDPDFIPPSSIVSRNFSMGEPASRPYNATFLIKEYQDKDKTCLLNEYKRGPKTAYDTTSISSLEAELRNLGKPHTEIKILHSHWEYDIRISKSNVPIINEYSPLSNNHPFTQRFLHIFNSNLYHELSEITYELENESIVIYYKPFTYKGSTFCIWSPLASKHTGRGRFRKISEGENTRVIYSKRLMYPQLKRLYLKVKPDGISRVIPHRFCYACILTYSSKIKQSIVAAYHDKLSREYNFNLVKTSQNLEQEITTDVFMHPEAYTSVQRHNLSRGNVPAGLNLEPIFLGRDQQ